MHDFRQLQVWQRSRQLVITLDALTRKTIRYLQIASGSACETENHLLIAADLGYLPSATIEELTGSIKSIQRMLIGLMNKLPD